MPQPHPGQDWRHGWIPVTPTAAKSKNHGRKPGGGSKIAAAAASAGEVLKRMRAQDANRNAKPNGPDAKAPSTPKPPAAQPAAAKKAAPAKAPAAKPQAKPATAPKATAKPATAKPGKKAGTDSHGKPLREGDEVRITGGHNQGKNGRVVSKGRGSGNVRVEVDGKEVDEHESNMRGRADHEAARQSRQADAAIRQAAGKGQVTIGQVQKDIRAAYDKIASKPGEWISLAGLRDKLSQDLPRDQVDAALRGLERRDDVHITPESNQKTLTDRQRAAAVNIGDQDKHLISMGRK